MKEKALLFETRGPVAWLTLNRPEAMNSINLQMVDLFEEYLPKIALDDAIRVLVLTGSGRAFCAGADLKEVLESANGDLGVPDFLDRVADNVWALLRDFPKPVIVALNGLTLAGGLETAMCADIVIAAETAKIGDAHANFGVYPGGGGAAVLPRLVPHNVAKYLLFTGETLTAKEMQAYGFVNQVLSHDVLIESVQQLAERISQNSPLALRRMKEVANATLDKSRDEALQHEQVMLRKHQRSFDMDEGLRAFAEKRKPNFKGH